MKKKFIGVIGIVIAVIVGGIYYLTREEKIELSLKNKKEIVTLWYEPHYLDTK